MHGSRKMVWTFVKYCSMHYVVAVICFSRCGMWSSHLLPTWWKWK